LSPDEKYIASGGYDHVIKIWNLITGNNTKTLYGHNNNIMSIIYTSNNKMIISGSSNFDIKIW
jgi:WD40 repeat protein